MKVLLAALAVPGPDFKERRRLKLGAGTGLVFDGTSVWTGWTKWEKGAPGYTSKIIRRKK